MMVSLWQIQYLFQNALKKHFYGVFNTYLDSTKGRQKTTPTLQHQLEAEKAERHLDYFSEDEFQNSFLEEKDRMDTTARWL